MMYFFERGVAALAWPMLAEAAIKGFGREELTDILPFGRAGCEIENGAIGCGSDVAVLSTSWPMEMPY